MLATRACTSLSLRATARKTATVRGLAIGDKLSDKEHVEENRFIREQEKKFFEKKKAELEAKMHEQELAIFEETVAPAMAEASALLKRSKDTVSDAGLEALAKWKLGMK